MIFLNAAGAGVHRIMTSLFGASSRMMADHVDVYRGAPRQMATRNKAYRSPLETRQRAALMNIRYMIGEYTQTREPLLARRISAQLKNMRVLTV